MVSTYFDQCFAAVDSQLDDVFGKSFFYRRAGQSIALVATLQSQTIEAMDSNGVMGSWNGHAFELAAADLVLDAVRFLPAAGDEIAEPIDGGGYEVYQVVTPPGKRCYAPVDAEGRKLLVFSQHMRSDP